MQLLPRPALALCCAALLLAASPVLAATGIKILAAENVYGAVAAAIAGPTATVTSVLTNPAQNPHDFEATAATARAVAAADLVILNGLDYDPWMDRLLGASPRPGRGILRVADLVGAHPGDNPHLWYNPTTMLAVAEAVTAKLSAWEPADAAGLSTRAKTFTEKVNAVQATIADMRKHFAGMPVAATEPVFGRMAAALGLDMRDRRFAIAVMNGTEPRAGDVAAIKDDISQRKIRVLFRNDQVTDAACQRLIGLAQAAHVPVVSIDETMPANTDYPTWMQHTLATVRAALSATP